MWGLWIRKVFGCYERSLMGHANRSLENGSVQSNVVVEIQLKQLLRGRKLVCSYFGKECDHFLPLTKILSEAKMKNLGLMLPAEEIPGQRSVDCHVVITDHSYAGLQWRGSRG